MEQNEIETIQWFLEKIKNKDREEQIKIFDRIKGIAEKGETKCLMNL